MRHIMFGILLGSTVFGQSILEHSAAAAGGSVGGVAGKKVSDGLSKILGTVDQQTSKAAKTAKDTGDKNTPLLEVGPGMPKKNTESVPPPPPIRRVAATQKPIVIPVPPPAPIQIAAPPAPPPPPPVMTADGLKQVSQGMTRQDLLSMGTPASRISMFDEGHLVELYQYRTTQTTLGVVRLSDGSVAKVDVR